MPALLDGYRGGADTPVRLGVHQDHVGGVLVVDDHRMNRAADPRASIGQES